MNDVLNFSILRNWLKFKYVLYTGKFHPPLHRIFKENFHIASFKQFSLQYFLYEIHKKNKLPNQYTKQKSYLLIPQSQCVCTVHVYSQSLNHRFITSRFNMSADVHPWSDFSLLTAPPPTTSGVKSH
jgi:hypothetical protein